MNKKIKTTLGVGALLLTTVILTSCNSFCSNEDSSHFRYGYDPINTTFFETQEQAEDYIIDQVKSLEEIDDKADISISDLQIYVLNDEGTEKTLQNINDTNIDLLIKRYNDNLVYLVPNNVYVNYQPENSEVTDTTFVTVGLSGFTISLINSAITQGIITPSFWYYTCLYPNFSILSSSLVDKSFSHSANPLLSLFLKNSKYFTLSAFAITTGGKSFFNNS